MGLNDYRGLSKITTASGLVSVTVNGVTFNAYKCVVADLELKLIPSPDSGASYQGAAVLMDTTSGNIGLFLLVAGNPSSTASGGINAREVWLAPWGLSNWAAEVGSSSLATDSTIITAPLANHEICFRPVTGTNPHLLNQITPTGASSGCVSATLIDQRVLSLSEDILKLKAKLVEAEAKVSLIDPSILLATGHSVIDGNILSNPSAFVVSSSPGRYIAYGSSYQTVSPAATSLNQRSIARLELLRDGTLFANYESSMSGTLDADYQCAALPFTSTPSWSIATTGSPSQNIINAMLSLTSPANSTISYSRATVGSLSVGAFLRVDLHNLNIPGDTFFDIEVDGGAGSQREVVRIWGQGSVLTAQLLSKYNANGARIFGIVLNPNEPFSIGLMLNAARSEMWINGQLADFSVPLATSGANGFKFGFSTSTAAGTRLCSISRVVSKNGTSTPISFNPASGAIVGQLVTTTSTAAKTIGLQGLDLDRLLGSRKEGPFANANDFNYRQEGIGRIFYDGSVEPPADGLGFNLAVSRSLYRPLFGKVGTSFGAGDGSTTFNTPQGAGRFIVTSSGGYPAYTTGGAASVTLAESNMPAHRHVLDPTAYGRVAVQEFYPSVFSGATNFQINGPFITNTIAGFAAYGFQSGFTGGGAAFNILPPYISIPGYIKWR